MLNFVNVFFYFGIKLKVEAEETSIKKGSRLTSLDLTRFFAMLMMMQGHTIFALAAPDVVDMSQPGWQFWNFLRGITAPTFLFVSGLVHIFANKRLENGRLSNDTIKKRLKMAMFIIAIGYILVFPASKIYDLINLSEESWRVFFQVNVLQMFGVSLILLLLHYLVTKSEKQLAIASLITGTVIMAISPWVHTIRWFEILPEFAGAYLTAEHGSIFPLFPFTAYLFFGSAFGAWLKSIKPENRTDFLLKYCWLMGIPLIAAGYPLMQYMSTMTLPFVDVMRVNPGLFLIRIGAVLTLISLMTLVYKMTTPLAKYYSLFGKRAIYIYVIHLFIIYGTPFSAGLNKFYRSSLSLEWAVMSAIAVVALTMIITYLYDKSVDKFAPARIAFKYAVTAYILYLFFI